MRTLTLFVELKLNPGQLDAFLARAREHRKNVLTNEPGCERFDLLTPEEEGDTVLLYEVYADRDSLDAHFETHYMREYLEDTGPMIASRTRKLCKLANE
jgi:quinol monooxygenase YgiN